MALGVNLSSFPKLNLYPGNVGVSWDDWLTQFEIAVELATLNLGKEDVGGVQVDKFKGRPKLLALLGAIGNEGIATLKSLGFDMKNAEDNGYETSLDLLKEHYEKEESFYVKTMKFVTVSQACGEEERDYLLRVQKLSRDMGFGVNNEELRQRFAVALAVNGLNGNSLRLRLLEINDLKWDRLSAILKARQLARETDYMLTGAKASHFDVKKESRYEVDFLGSSDCSIEESRNRCVNKVYKNEKYSRDSSESSSSSVGGPKGNRRGSGGMSYPHRSRGSESSLTDSSCSGICENSHIDSYHSGDHGSMEN